MMRTFDLRETHPTHAGCVTQSYVFQVRIGRCASVADDRHLEPKLARINCCLHYATLRRGPDQDQSLNATRLEEKFESGMVECGVPLLQQHRFLSSGNKRLDQ